MLLKDAAKSANVFFSRTEIFNLMLCFVVPIILNLLEQMLSPQLCSNSRLMASTVFRFVGLVLLNSALHHSSAHYSRFMSQHCFPLLRQPGFVTLCFVLLLHCHVFSWPRVLLLTKKQMLCNTILKCHCITLCRNSYSGTFYQKFNPSIWKLVKEQSKNDSTADDNFPNVFTFLPSLVLTTPQTPLF